MATPAQAAAATVGAGSLAAAGAYGITQVVSGDEESTTEEQNINPSTFTREDLTGGTYNNKFLSLTKEENLQFLVKTDSNKGWWKWAYENKYRKELKTQKLDSLFSNLDSFDNLIKACEEAYKKDKEHYKFEDDSYLIDNISSFCTKGSEKQDVSEPKSISYASAQTDPTYKDGVLGLEANAVALVKKENENNNDLWWNWAYKNIYSNSRGFTKSDPFDSVSSGYEDTNGLSYACDEAYKKLYFELKEDNNSLLNQIKKFCSNKEVELTLPGAGTPTYINDKVDSTSPYNTENSLAKKGNNKTKLVDPESNENWWVWTFDHRFPKNGSKDFNNLPDIFKSVTSGFKENADAATGKQTALNQACKEAYSKKKTEVGQTSQANSIVNAVTKLCTLNTNSLTLELPDKD